MQIKYNTKKFTVKQNRNIIYKADNIRNISVIAYIDQRKSTFIDYLIAKAGIIFQEHTGTARFIDNRADEKERGINIK